jgi:hypothetical protein
MSARLVPEASIAVPLFGPAVDAATIVADPELSIPLRAAVAAFVSASGKRPTPLADPLISD